MTEQCENNGYTPFENDVQEAIKDLVPRELYEPISTRVGDLFRKAALTPAPRQHEQARGDALESLLRKGISAQGENTKHQCLCEALHLLGNDEFNTTEEIIEPRGAIGDKCPDCSERIDDFNRCGCGQGAYE